jgi:hypothetical protein
MDKRFLHKLYYKLTFEINKLYYKLTFEIKNNG